MTGTGLATRQDLRLRADPARVVSQLFVPGHAFPGGGGRASELVEHLRSLADDEVERSLAAVRARFEGRHRDLLDTLRSHADRIRNRLPPDEVLSEDRWLLLGATFTQEYALEGAALCNPSMLAVPAPPERGAGSVDFVMSVRQIGEGHRSSIGFRSGTIDRDGAIALDDAAPFATTGATVPATALRGSLFRDGSEACDWVLDGLDPVFGADALDERLAELGSQHDTRRDVAPTIARMRSIAARSYTTTFPADSAVGERVLFPVISAESNGIEDARFVRLTDADGRERCCATYTAFDGSAIVQQLLETDDLRTFTTSPLLGPAAANKGFALFPRTIDGDFVALTRFDGANNAVARSRDLNRWSDATYIQHPRAAWETVQVGNCGSPIETGAGWLVLTHGVGPMRTYSIGAWLLDIDDPTRLIGHLETPLLAPTAAEQDGYVPNVVYSCGALVHGDHLVVPYGIGDASIGFAAASIDEVLGAMTGRSPR